MGDSMENKEEIERLLGIDIEWGEESDTFQVSDCALLNLVREVQTLRSKVLKNQKEVWLVGSRHEASKYFFIQDVGRFDRVEECEEYINKMLAPHGVNMEYAPICFARVEVEESD